MALRFPSPFHDVGRRRVPAAGEVESGWRRGAVVIRTILFQRFTRSLCLSTRLSCSSQNGCQVQQLSSVSSMSKVSRQLSQRVAVILGVLPEPADQVASTIASFGLFIATQAFRHAASRSRLNARDKYR